MAGFNIYDIYGDSGLFADDEGRINDFMAGAPKKGKFFKQVMRDPGGYFQKYLSPAIENEARGLEETFTFDPGLPIEVQAGQLNKAKQQLRRSGVSEFMSQIPGLQSQLYGQNLNRKLSIYGTNAQLLNALMSRRAQNLKATPKTSFWGALAKIAIPAALSAFFPPAAGALGGLIGGGAATQAAIGSGLALGAGVPGGAGPVM